MGNPTPRLRLETDSALPADIRRRQLAEVKRRLESGELDSDTALRETAAALLDGDPPP